MKNLLTTAISIFLLSGLALAEDKKKNCEELFKVERVAESDAIDREFVDELLEEAHGSSDPVQSRFQQLVQRVGIQNATLNTDIIHQHNPMYSVSLPEGAVQNQLSSGRCWIFAGLNQIRSELRRKQMIPPEFHFSENYLHFWNMFEKSGRFLASATNSMASGKPRKLMLEDISLHGHISDGGYWSYFQMLVQKYGIVPSYAMPETASAVNTGELNSDIQTRLASAAEKIRQTIGSSKKADLSQDQLSKIENIRKAALKDVFSILVTHLGKPPVKFEVKYPDEAKLAALEAFNQNQKALNNPEIQNLLQQVDANPGMVQQIEQAAANGDQKALQDLHIVYKHFAKKQLAELQKDQDIAKLVADAEKDPTALQQIYATAMQGDTKALWTFISAFTVASAQDKADIGVDFEKIASGVHLVFMKSEEMTPVEYAKQIGFDPDEFITVTNHPSFKKGHYEIEGTAIGHSKPGESEYDLHLYNVDNDRMEELVMASIDSGNAVWFAADIGKDVYMEQKQHLEHKTTAILNTDLYDRDTVYGYEGGEDSLDTMDREAKFFYRHTMGNHAMLFTAYDRPDPSKPAVKYLVENSWGKYVGDEGHMHMYRNWFRANVTQVVVHRSLFTEEELAEIDGQSTKVEDDEWF